MKSSSRPHGGEGYVTRTALFMAGATLLIGLGYSAMTPTFEGFDEYAYYSSARQVADTGTLPFYRRSFIDKNVLQYLKLAPRPWETMKPPFERRGRMTYPSFFANAEAVARYRDYQALPADWSFAPSAALNWEAQHPPLYYILMAPVMKATEGLSLVTQVLVLRTISYLLAFTGFMIGWRATRSQNVPDGVVTGFLLYPLIVPMFFGEFARIGSDSLCLLLVALIYGLSFRVIYRDEPDQKSAFAIGILFALGLWTKAFFLPILASYALVMAVGAWRARYDGASLKRKIGVLALVVIPALALGAEWYVYEYFTYGSVLGSYETINLAQQGGLPANVLRNFTFYQFARQLVVIFVTWSWGGSWSLARISPDLHLPLLMLTAWIIISYFGEARRHALIDRIWLPTWVLVPFFAGLVHHILVSIAEGTSGTPGWYLNVLTPFLALAGGHGIQRINKSGTGRLVLGASLTYATLFLLIVMWSQLALFTGCAIKNYDKYYKFSGHLFCLDQLVTMTDRLSVIAWPLWAMLGIGGGLLCLVLGLLSFFLGRDSTATQSGNEFPPPTAPLSVAICGTTGHRDR